MRSLFDQLYQGLDITSSNAEAPQHPMGTPATKTPELGDVANGQQKNDITGMKFTHSLIKHLDQLYSKMLAGEVSELASEPKSDAKTRVIEGQTSALILEEKESYYNPGNSAVTESF
jgi:hypothetical protein